MDLTLDGKKLWDLVVGEDPDAFLNRIDEEIEDEEFIDREEAFLDFAGQKLHKRDETKELARKLQEYAESQE